MISIFTEKKQKGKNTTRVGNGRNFVLYLSKFVLILKYISQDHGKGQKKMANKMQATICRSVRI